MLHAGGAQCLPLLHAVCRCASSLHGQAKADVREEWCATVPSCPARSSSCTWAVENSTKIRHSSICGTPTVWCFAAHRLFVILMWFDLYSWVACSGKRHRRRAPFPQFCVRPHSNIPQSLQIMGTSTTLLYVAVILWYKLDATAVPYRYMCTLYSMYLCLVITAVNWSIYFTCIIVNFKQDIRWSGSGSL